MKPSMPRKVLVLGSGAIKIGEAGEFDYSGAQAIKALREEGIEAILVNSNIATIQSDEKFVDKAYFVPINADFIEGVIATERPDGIMLSFGGQTALNAGIELHERGILEKYGVKIYGTGIFAIEECDDREKFRHLMETNGLPVPKSMKANSVEEAMTVAQSIGFPVMVRVAYALGGAGSGVVRDESSLANTVSRGLAQSRIHQVLVESYLGGWKEIEYEVMRDSSDNCTIVCNIENVDPLGIHTGDSIVVAPSQTLTNRDYHSLRMTAFKAIRALKIIGECNIQFALDPNSDDFKIIEVNSRLSRSSALASKATGYPIAYIAAKLALGYSLPDLINKVTGSTSACYEPALDYVVVKIPRWDFQKFRRASNRIGTQMKSVGEVMAIGRTFEEALQKAVRMLDIKRELTDTQGLALDLDSIKDALRNPTDMRLFYIVKALEAGIGIDEINLLTSIDRWFLFKIGAILGCQESVRNGPLDRELLLKAKRMGFSDRKISSLVGNTEEGIRALRKSLGITPVVKQIDTLAAEWPAITNYLYMTYNGSADDIEFKQCRKAIVLGSGCYRIGSSVEFDWCCVNMGIALRSSLDEVIMINCNPETVSTDFDIFGKLYFEEITPERVLDIADRECPIGVVVSVGGQTPNNIAARLERGGLKILGTSVADIDRAEDRSKFGTVLDSLGIEQPRWRCVSSNETAKEFARDVGFPVLVRPSYVLSGSAMNVAFDEAHLAHCMDLAFKASGDGSVVMSKFMTGAKEVDVDGICDGSNIFIGGIMEHVENAGRHSGDATMCLPSITLDGYTKELIRECTRKISSALRIRGPFNIQYMVKDRRIFVIECNLRASRSMPFVSKSIGVNLMLLAEKAIMGGRIKPGEGMPKRYGVKSPQFSFMPLEGADPVGGVEMESTGEAACFGDTFEEALIESMMATGIVPPAPGDSVLLSIGKDKPKMIPMAAKLSGMGMKLYATEKTAHLLIAHGLPCEVLHKVSENIRPNILDYLSGRRISMVINIPQINGDRPRQKYEDGYAIRRKAIEYRIPVITNLELAEAMVKALESLNNRRIALQPIFKAISERR